MTLCGISLTTGFWSQPPCGSPEAAGIRLSSAFCEDRGCLWLPLGSQECTETLLAYGPYRALSRHICLPIFPFPSGISLYSYSLLNVCGFLSVCLFVVVFLLPWKVRAMALLSPHCSYPDGYQATYVLKLTQ